MSIEEDCPVYSASETAKRMFARAKVAEHIKDRAVHDERHETWVDEHTEYGTISERRAALGE